MSEMSLRESEDSFFLQRRTGGDVVRNKMRNYKADGDGCDAMRCDGTGRDLLPRRPGGRDESRLTGGI